jgi:hypothetical protein
VTASDESGADVTGVAASTGATGVDAAAQ